MHVISVVEKPHYNGIQCRLKRNQGKQKRGGIFQIM